MDKRKKLSGFTLIRTLLRRNLVFCNKRTLLRKNLVNVQQGFTLIELLVVLAIISILATILLAAFRSSQVRSRDAARKSDLKEISQALELFYSDHRFYPGADLSSGEIVACPWKEVSQTNCTWGEDRMSDDDRNAIYFRILPEDPINSQNYFYRTLDNQQAYQIYAHLENEEDKACIKDAATKEPDCATLLSDTNCGIGDENCNFAITSPNVNATDR